MAAVVGTDERAENPGMFARVAPTWLTQMPTTVPRDQAKIYFTRLAVPILGALVHIVLIGVYLWFSAPGMALVNAVSVGIFCFAIALVRSGKHRVGTIVSIIEVSIHAPVATVMLGPKAGYLIFNFIVAMCAVLTYTRHEKRQRQVVIIYAFVSSVVVSLYMRHRAPIIHLTDMQLTGIFVMICTTTYFALCGFAYHFVNICDRAEARLDRELRRSEKLLLNILPAQVAQRLKAQPGTIADSFPSATVLFADIVGFTKLASVSSGDEIVTMLNNVFSAFDRIAAKYGLEKIKTIGDAYMVVGGIPNPTPDHAEKVVRMAVDMMAAIRLISSVADAPPLEIRIGIHSGPVVAGVIGEKKFAYDLWGDTVNTASRMESHGMPGHIQVSDQTAKLLPTTLPLTDRGAIEIKGKGQIRTWLVNLAEIIPDTSSLHDTASFSAHDARHVA